MKTAGLLVLLTLGCAVGGWWFLHRSVTDEVKVRLAAPAIVASAAPASTAVRVAVAGQGTTAVKLPKPALDPAYVAQVTHDAHVGYMSAAFGDFIRDAALTPEQGARLLEVLAAERQAALQLIVDARARGSYWGDNPYLEPMVLAAATGRDSEIADLLGPEKFAKFQDYRATAMLRMTVNDLNDALVDRGEALSDAQALQLVQTFAALDSPAHARRAPISAVVQTVGMPVTSAMVDAARSILSPTQLAALEAIRLRQQTPQHPTVGGPTADR